MELRNWLHAALFFNVFCIELLIAGNDGSDEHTATAAQIEFFESKIRPLLATHCYSCHSAGANRIEANLLLDSRPRILKGGDSGAAMVPNDSANSPLIAAVRYESYEMPPKGKLSQSEIDLFVQWVDMGAPWPNEPEPTGSGTKPAFDLAARKESHWVWKPIGEPPIPDVANEKWCKQTLDRFILARLESEKLSASPPVDKRGLIRRLSFDLLGLPPAPDAVERFEKDGSEHALEELVDSMLRSPQFGERWGRHWLDLVRYAESRGHEFDADTPNAFQYRDYVIRAFNDDVPYDQFVREHIAGDVLDRPRLHPNTGANESILGTGFWHMGEWVHSPVDIRKDETDRFDNMIDVMSKTFIGVTVSCARCHDHKFDAISTRDYYSLSGFLQGSEYRQSRFETIEKERAVAKELSALDQQHQAKWKAKLKGAWLDIRTALLARLQASGNPKDGDWRQWTPSAEPSLDKLPDGTVVIADYTKQSGSPILQDGFVFGPRIAAPYAIVPSVVDGKGTLRIQSYSAVRNDLFWNGLVSTREKPTNLRTSVDSTSRPSRTFVTSPFEVAHGAVSVLLRGNATIVASVDSHRLVVGPLHGETIIETRSNDTNIRWANLNLKRYLGHRVHLEITPMDNEALEVLALVDAPSAPTENAVKNSPRDVLAKPESLVDRIDAAIQWWTNNPVLESEHTLDKIDSLNWLLQQPELIELNEMKTAWLEARQKLRDSLPSASALAMAMLDCTGEDDRVLIRGSSGAPGETVPRRFLEAIDGNEPLPIERGSGRLELAARINDPANPLTSRVIVNRVWHHLLGRGIVPTVDDFGVLGQQPTHPELLDHLAQWFDRNGRSIKKLIRYIVLSQTYQMSGQSNQEAVAIDPKNLLWHHVPPKRLSGEAIRDSLLAISGDIDLKMYGESIPIHLTAFMEGRGRPGASGPLDGAKRRSIYVAVRRNFLSPFMLTFDTPNPFSTMGKRNVSNVPAQALIMLNDPFVVEQANHWAQRALREVPNSDDRTSSTRQRVQWMYEMAFSRLPTQTESQIAIEYFANLADPPGRSGEEVAAWADFAHVLINTKEFVFLR